MYTRRQIKFVIKSLFLFTTLIYSLKQENETYQYIDYSQHYEKTYTEFVVDHNANSNLPYYYSDFKFQHENSPGTCANYRVLRATLKLSIYHYIDTLYILSPPLSPNAQILKILQKKNIHHQSSDDTAVQYVYC
jgi:hypothetical protein